MQFLPGFVVLLAVSCAHADPVLFSYNFTAPPLNANQNIVGFGLSVDVLSSAVGPNIVIADPKLANKLAPNPFTVPTPNCVATPQNCSPVPITTNGVDPKTLQDPQFFFDPSDPKSFSVTKGVAQNKPNDKPPGVPAGTTIRTDNVALSWEALFFPAAPVVFGAGNQLKFGATLEIQRAYDQRPKTGTSKEPPPPRPVYRDTFSKERGIWKLDDGSSVQSGQKAVHTIRMGMDATDPGLAGLFAGLSFAYTNDAFNNIVLSDLGFETFTTELPLDVVGAIGTPLSGAIVTLNGLLQSSQSFYSVPVGGTLEFFFPGTSDSFFIARGLVSADGLPELGFAYETRLTAPEPPAWTLLAAAMLVLIGMRARTTARRVLRRGHAT